MKVVYVHASKYGNGARVADEFRSRMANHDIAVETHHVEEVEPETIPPADLYVFSSPGRMGRPIRSIRHFLRDVRLPRGTRYALLTTEMAPQPNKKTGVVPTDEEICRFQHVRPIMIELLQHKGLVKVAEEKVYVTDLKGPLEDGWLAKVDAFADSIADGPQRERTARRDVTVGRNAGTTLLVRDNRVRRARMRGRSR